MKLRFLGTGTSVGVPQIGCSCKTCTSTDFRDKRRRCGAYVSTEKGAFLIDTPPELREACIAYGVSKVDAVVLTHAHMDHVAAFDDVRRFNTINGEKVPCDPNEPGANGRTFRVIGKPMTCYCSAETEEQMHRIFPYIGAKGGENGLFRPQILFDNAAVFELAGVRVERLGVEHGFPCSGYLLVDAAAEGGSRYEGGVPRSTVPPSALATAERSETAEGRGVSKPCASLGYISDCHEIPDETIAKLRGVDVMVLNCLREREHPTHLSLARARAYLERIAPKKAYLIHMCHDFTHAEWQAKLAGTNIEPAYDGLEIAL